MVMEAGLITAVTEIRLQGFELRAAQGGEIRSYQQGKGVAH